MKSLFVWMSLFLAQSALSDVNFQEVVYEGHGQKFQGFLAQPKDLKTNAPMIVMVHNWMGVTEETKTQAARFVKLGYQVFAADVYGQGVRPKNAQEAGTLSSKYKKDRALLRKHLDLAYQTALKQKMVDAKKVAAAGYCFGGTAVLEMARAGLPLKSVISFHGGLDSLNPIEAKNIQSKVLVLHGEADPFVPKADIEAFLKEMKTHQVKFQMVNYPNAVHSFTEKAAGNDPSKGAAYNAEADAKSFVEAEKELKSVF